MSRQSREKTWALLALVLIAGCSTGQAVKIESAAINKKNTRLVGWGTKTIEYVVKMQVENLSWNAMTHLESEVQCRDPKRSNPWASFPMFQKIEGGIEPGETREVTTGIPCIELHRLRKEHPNAEWVVVNGKDQTEIQIN